MRQGWGRYFNPSRGAATNGILCKVREMAGNRCRNFLQVSGWWCSFGPLREQARSHSIGGGLAIFVTHQDPCGSGLARESARSGTIKSGRYRFQYP